MLIKVGCFSKVLCETLEQRLTLLIRQLIVNVLNAESSWILIYFELNDLLKLDYLRCTRARSYCMRDALASFYIVVQAWSSSLPDIVQIHPVDDTRIFLLVKSH